MDQCRQSRDDDLARITSGDSGNHPAISVAPINQGAAVGNLSAEQRIIPTPKCR
jgi:hypothetical protein